MVPRPWLYICNRGRTLNFYMGEKGPENQNPTQKPRPKSPKAQPQPPSLLDKVSDTFKNFTRRDMADIVSAPLTQGLKAVKELKNTAENKLIRIRILQMDKVRGMVKTDEFKDFLKSPEEKDQYIDVLVEIYKNIGEKKFEEFIKIIINGLIEIHIPFDPSPPFPSRKFFRKGTVLNLKLLRELSAASKIMPENIIFLTEKYLNQDYLDRALSNQEEEDREYTTRSFSLPEMMEILKKHGKEGQTIIEFIDVQLRNKNFKNRKKFILQHLEQFKKLAAYFESQINPDDSGERYKNRFYMAKLNLDLLNEGDHMETLQKLLGIDPETGKITEGTQVIANPCEEFFDRKYIKDHAAKLVQIRANIGSEIVLPTSREMDKNGDLLLEIAMNTGALPLEQDYDRAHRYYVGEPKVSRNFRKIYEKFGWASFETAFVMDKLSKKEQKDIFHDISLPENRELMDSLGEISIAVEEELRKRLALTNPNPSKSEQADINKERAKIKDIMSKVLIQSLVHFHNGWTKEHAKQFIQNYDRYPKVAAILLERMLILQTNGKLNISDLLADINRFFERLRFSLPAKGGYEKISAVLELMPDFGSMEEDSAGVVDTGDYHFHFFALGKLLDDKKVDIIFKNRDFIRKYLQETRVISFDNNEFINNFSEHFPLWAVEKHQKKLWKLAKLYGPRGLQTLVLDVIKTEEDLDFYITNSKKLAPWLERTLNIDLKYENEADKLRGFRHDFLEDFPSHYLLSEYFDYVNEFTGRTHDEFKVRNQAESYGKIFRALNDDEFLRKNGKFFFEIFRYAFGPDGNDITERDLRQLISEVKKLQDLPEKHRQQILHIFSRYIEPDGPARIIMITEILVFFKEHPNLLDENFTQLQDVLEEFLKPGFGIGKIFPHELVSLLALSPSYKDLEGRVSAYNDVKVLQIGRLKIHYKNKDKRDGAMDNIFVKDHEKVMRLLKLIRLTDLGENMGITLRGFSDAINHRHDIWESIDEAIKNFFDKYGESPSQESLRKCHNTLKYAAQHLGGEKYNKSLELMIDKIGEIEPIDFSILTFLKNRGCKESVLENYSKGPFNPANRMRYILYDYETQADLREFDYKKISVYGKIFQLLRGVAGNPEEEVAKAIKTDKFAAEMVGKDVFEVERIINACANVISPHFGEILLKKILIPKIRTEKFIGTSLKKWLGKDANGKPSKIDVTQNNMAQINALIRLFYRLDKIYMIDEIGKRNFAKIIEENIRIVFPEFVGTGEPRADLQWLLAKFDVKEINFDKLDSYTEFIELQQLLSGMTESGVKSAAKYLESKIKDIDFTKMSFEEGNYSLFDIDEAEKLRQLVNSKNKIMGDMLIDILGSKFLEANCCNFENMGKLLQFARAWENPGLNRDVDGLYQVYSTYAYVEIASFLKENLEREKSDKDKNREIVRERLAKHGIDLDKLIAELEAKNYLTLTESNLDKATTNLKNGLIKYTFRKGASKLLGEESVEFDGKKIRMLEADWAERKGVKVYSLTEDGREIAKIIKCDPKKIKAKVLAEPDGVVNMDEEAKRLGKKLIFSAPLTFTTGARKMTELAFRDGVQMNYLLSPYTKDGFLLVNEAGEQKVLNKKRLKISDVIGPEDLQNEEIKDVLTKWARANKFDETKPEKLLEMPIKPAQRFFDKKTFFALLQIKRYSLLGGMLLIDKEEGKDEGTIVKLNDGGDSRRFYLEFADGQFGIIDSTENISSGRLVDLALLAGATKAVYMDTGMYDMAAYKDGSGKDHIMGHQDTSESTNRVVIYER